MKKITSSLSEGDIEPFRRSTAVRLYLPKEQKWIIGIRYSIRMQNGACVVQMSPYMRYTSSKSADPESAEGELLPADATPIAGSYVKLTGSYSKDEQPFLLRNPRKIECEHPHSSERLIFRSDTAIFALSYTEHDFESVFAFLKRHQYV
jgi:hypothetical protein